ncbi:MAG: CPBP family intramembrane metalloprotease domain-containing protein [Verrucomicrobia bacterium]|nr:CPBP family intramembrane metalloprotease domain-containing protein [Verrucomicrobiota bacterium]
MIQLKGKLAKLLVLFGLCLVFGGMFAMLGIEMANVIFDVQISALSEIFTGTNTEGFSPILKFIQGVQSIGLFIFPAIIFGWLFAQKSALNLRIHPSISIRSVLLLLLLFVSYLPIINLTVELNSMMKLPAFLSELEAWMLAAEDNAEQLTLLLLKMDTPLDLAINLLIVGVIPALGEELIFRGHVQRILNIGKSNGHFGIWISAILFSALHMQFYGFLPRLLLGAFFGYLFHWSKNLWIPIIAHFINNASAVVVTYLIGTAAMEEKVDTIGTTGNLPTLSLLFLTLFVVLLIFSRKHFIGISQRANDS